MLDTTISELREIARSLHPMQLGKLGMTKAVSHLLDQIDNETDIFVPSEMEEIKGNLNKEEEHQLYSIIQEPINNALKHSKAIALKVILKSTENHMELRILDNGKDFDFSEKLMTAKV